TVVVAVPHRRRHADGGELADRKPYEPPDEDEEEDEDEDDDEETAEAADSQRIYTEAIAAIRGESKHPSEALNEFIQTFGRAALEGLRKEITDQATAETFGAGGRTVRRHG